MERLITGLAIGLLFSAVTPAEESSSLMPDLFDDNAIELHYTSPEMSIDEYHYATRQNQRLINQAVMSLMNDRLDSMGTTGTALKYTGAAAFMAIKGAKFNLNDSKTMAIEVNELADDDREILYRYKIAW